MGFMDKVKEVGNQAATAVNEAVDKGQQTFNESQAKKQADGLLRDLGVLVYLRDSGRGDETTDAEIVRVTAALRAHEASAAVIDLTVRSGATAAAAPPADPAMPPPAAGSDVPPPPGAVGGS